MMFLALLILAPPIWTSTTAGVVIRPPNWAHVGLTPPIDPAYSTTDWFVVAPDHPFTVPLRYSRAVVMIQAENWSIPIRVEFGWMGSADFDNDGDTGTDADVDAFFACLGGNCCGTCGSADFDGDGDVGTDEDIEVFYRTLGGA
jgi:hypothetical protein